MAFAQLGRRLLPSAWLGLQQGRGFVVPMSMSTLGGGITMPSPSKLEDLMRVDELLHKDPDEITSIWLKYHEEIEGSKMRVGGVMLAEEFKKLQERSKKCPLFVLPLGKPGGGFLTLLLQCQMPYVLFTTLEEYTKSGPHAAPHLTLTNYTELMDNKGVVLVRGDIVNSAEVSPNEARLLMELTRAFYTHDEDYIQVEQFNHRQSEFDFNALLKKLGHVDKT